MDRRAKKLEKKRKSRALAKKKAKIAALGAASGPPLVSVSEPDDDDDDWPSSGALAPDEAVIHSTLERTVASEQTRLQIYIYRGPRDANWLLEVEDHSGGSTVWDDPFETEQAALDAALLAIDEDGIESFVVTRAEGV